MKKTIISQQPEHIEARSKYGENLNFVSNGANITQIVEGINSSIIMLILFYSHVGKYGTVAVVAASLVAIALSYTVQSVLRGSFSTYSRLKNDNKDDKFQRSEIRFSLVAGIVSAFIALSLTFSSSYAMSKAVNATERHSIVSVNSDFDAKLESEKEFWLSAIETERSDYEKTVNNIENKFDAKVKTAKTDAEKAFVLSQKQKVLDKNKSKFDAKIKDIEQQKNKDLQTILDAKNAAVSAAQVENSENETAENTANNMAWWSFFFVSVVLVSTSVVFVYKKAAYMEKCGITVVNEREAVTNYHTAVIVKTVFRRFFVNHIKKAFVNFNNRFGTDLDDIIGSGIKQQTVSRPKSNSDKIVFTAPAEIIHPKQDTETVETKAEHPQTNVVEFDLNKSVPFVEQQKTENNNSIEQKKQAFISECSALFGGVLQDDVVNSLLDSYRSENSKDISPRKAAVKTYSKRYYEYQSKGKSQLVKRQAQTMLANGLYLIERGVKVTCNNVGGVGIISIDTKNK